VIKVDHAKAALIFSRLLYAYLHRVPPFDHPKARPPQRKENLPPSLVWGSREHALFLFASCYWMRGGIQSHTAIRSLTKLYASEPHIFLPESAQRLSVEDLAAKFRDVGLGFNADQIGGMWKENLARIARRWKGDPRNIFKGITSYHAAVRRIKNLKGRGFLSFQEKMVSMLIYFYMDAGIIDPWNFPMPIDFHWLRTVFAHEIVVAHKRDGNSNGFYTKPVLAAVRELSLRYCIEQNADPLLLCEAVWLYSGLMCNQHPGNQSEVGVRHGRKTELFPILRWSPAQTRTYERTCGSCIIQETCTWCVPSAAYYIRGRIDLREKRDAPPQQNLFL
jgi:hypothetical protein